MIKLLLIGTFLATAAFSHAPVESLARCATPIFEDEFDNSAAVFVGNVVKAEKKGDNRVFVFEVKHYWKGVDSREITVSVTEWMRYQAIFEEGKTYLVFAKADDDGALFDGRCSRSAEIGGYSSSLKDDLEKLGDAKTCINLEELEKE